MLLFDHLIMVNNVNNGNYLTTLQTGINIPQVLLKSLHALSNIHEREGEEDKTRIKAKVTEPVARATG